MLGTTYSHRHIQELGLDISNSLKVLLELEFDIVRIGIYWDEIEKDEGEYDFSGVHELLKEFESHDQNLIVTIGMKSPRWPEFYIPSWLENKSISEIEPFVLRFMEESINELKSYSCIKYWQLENEPLDPSGPDNKFIPIEILKKEIDLVKGIDTRKIIVNLWGNNLSKRNNLEKIEPYADIIGLDIYYQQYHKGFLNRTIYKGPEDSDKKLKEIIKICLKPIWITELQSEPWEKDEETKFTLKSSGFDAQKLNDNYERTKDLGTQTILFWGFEYWYWRMKHGDSSFIIKIQELKNL